MTLNISYRKKMHRKRVEKMNDLSFMRSLSDLGTYEDMTNIIQYLTSKCLMTPDKLQGMLWFAYAWGLVILNIEIAPFIFVQTPYGPAELNVNQLYPIWDTAIIPQYSTPKLKPQIEKLLDAVIRVYGSLSASELSARYASHCSDVPAGEEISARDIFLFFSNAAYSDNIN